MSDRIRVEIDLRDGGVYHGDTALDCYWFAKCDHPAVTVEPHPILGDVPICQRCAAKIAKWKQ